MIPRNPKTNALSFSRVKPHHKHPQVGTISPRMAGQQSFYAFDTSSYPFGWMKMFLIQSPHVTRIYPFPASGKLNAYVGTKTVENRTPFI
jgi:hypothetical protein